jgi:rRNA-processing protein FCF1
MKEKFLLDTNTFISPYEAFYPFDFAQHFWAQLSPSLTNYNIAIIDTVLGELKKGGDELSTWVSKISSIHVIDTKQTQIINKYAEVIKYVQTCGYYTDRALREWSQIGVADLTCPQKSTR